MRLRSLKLPDIDKLNRQRADLEKVERQMIDTLNKALSDIGYCVTKVDGTLTSIQNRPPERRRRRNLKCPKCDRRFTHPLPMARHMKATHDAKKKK